MARSNRLTSALLLFVVPALLPAQAAAPATFLDVGGFVGVQFRNDDGAQVNGTRLAVNLTLARPVERPFAFGGGEVTLGYAQMKVRGPISPVQENSLELAVIADAVVARAGIWRLDAGVGPVLSSSLGCTTDGAGTQPAGSVTCPHSYADHGNTMVGYRVRANSGWRNGRATFLLGVDLTGHTIASGPNVASAVSVGLRYQLRTLGR